MTSPPPLPWFKRFLPRGLLGRSLLILVTPLIIVQAVSTYVFYGTHWDTVARRLAGSLGGDISAVIELLRVFPEQNKQDYVLSLIGPKMDLQLHFEKSAILPNIPPMGRQDPVLQEILSERLQKPFRIDSFSSGRDVFIWVQMADGVLEISVPRKRLFSSTTYIFVLWMIGTSILLLGIAGLFMRNQVRSVRKLAAAVDGFGKGRETPVFQLQGATEVRQVARAFNVMRDRIGRQIQQRTEMLAGVSHDLRTPLTRMRLQLAMMEGVDGTTELQEDVIDMERMIEDYLAFARGEGSEKSTQNSIKELLSVLVSRFQREGKDVSLTIETSLSLPLRPHAVTRALSNLIGNATRYGQHVEVKALRQDDDVVILVDDDGPGIAQDMREAVFKAFFRLDSSRNMATGGTGLGLSIARDIARGHGGDILLEDSPLGGLRARLRLPL